MFKYSLGSYLFNYESNYGSLFELNGALQIYNICKIYETQ